MRRFAIFLGVVGSAAIPSAVSGETLLPADRQVRVYSIVSSEGYSYNLYLDAGRTECVDALPSSDEVRLRLDRAVDEEWRGSARSVTDLRVRVRHEKMTGFPPSLQVTDDGDVLVSSSGGIFHEGRQVFLGCQDYSAPGYDVYFVEEASGD